MTLLISSSPEATMAAPEFVTIPADYSAVGDSNSLRSCLVGSSSSTSSRSSTDSTAPRHRRVVRLNDDESIIVRHEPPVALQEALGTTMDRKSLWYTGADIRRIKQACVPLLTRLDAGQTVSHAIEVDWRTGTTSTRGLEFGTRTGQQRKRAALQFQRLVLQEQARLRQSNGEADDVSYALAVRAATAAQPAVHLALDIAIQDAAFVCQYVENVARIVTAPTRSPPIVVTLMRRMWSKARHNVQEKRRQQALKRRPVLSHKTLSTASDLRPRCDTESTTTLMACA